MGCVSIVSVIHSLLLLDPEWLTHSIGVSSPTNTFLESEVALVPMANCRV